MLALASKTKPDYSGAITAGADIVTASGAGERAQAAIQAAGATATAIGAAAGASWVPIVGPIIAGVSLGLAAIFNRKGPKQKIASTKIADEIERLLKENLDGYMASERTRTIQAYALKNFDDAWAFLSGPEGCGNPELGEPGRRCISERQRGGSAPWCPTGTGCDWFTLYHDPIANDQAKPDSRVPVLSTLDLPALPAATGRIIVPIILIALGLLLWD